MFITLHTTFNNMSFTNKVGQLSTQSIQEQKKDKNG
jgi:hypothetical protein